jgi:hypothetical protein
MDEWANSVCDGDYEGLTFATTIMDSNLIFWVVSMILLALSLTADCCNHILYLRAAPPIWKIMLLL